MKYSEASLGRIFIIRLEDGDIVHEEIEKLAAEKEIRSAAIIILGGANDGSKQVLGPADPDESPIVPMVHTLAGVHEVAGVGTLFQDEYGSPSLHMHMASGRKDSTVTGCIRVGVKVWQTMEAVLFELNDTTAMRYLDQKLGFKLLKP
ncbi:DUF296 domain-containing protein [Candidatus Poribacteria bacterium]|nr:DUF296 domain-containing protein [Candidatus Poribacteria bacterium]